jgi:DNA-binding helix-hairpin-helix protein with protein kinase domain
MAENDELSLPFKAVRVRQNTPITLVKKFGSGGEGTIYKIREDASLLVKVYKKDPPTAKLNAMLDAPPEDPMLEDGHTSIAWPQDLVADAKTNRIIGYLMPKAGSSNEDLKLVPYLNLFSTQTRLQKLPEFTYQDLHTVASNLALAFASVHEVGHVVGDVNESNVLVTEEACVSVVDTDSFQIITEKTGKIYRCTVGKPEYTPPELQGLRFSDVDRIQQHDRFGLSVLIFQLLMLGFHPADGQYRGAGDPPNRAQRIKNGDYPFFSQSNLWLPPPSAPLVKVLDPKLRRLFEDCFIRGHRDPASRPAAETWLDTFEEVINNLDLCNRNPQHFYGRHLISCPWCEQAQQPKGIDPFSPAEIAPMRKRGSKIGHRKQKKRSVTPSGARSIGSVFPAPAPLQSAPATGTPVAGGGVAVASPPVVAAPSPTKTRLYLKTVLQWTAGYSAVSAFIFWLTRKALASLAPELQGWLLTYQPVSFQMITPLQWVCGGFSALLIGAAYFLLRNRS